MIVLSLMFQVGVHFGCLQWRYGLPPGLHTHGLRARALASKHNKSVVLLKLGMRMLLCKSVTHKRRNRLGAGTGPAVSRGHSG
jgi:hypothetical protein